MHSAIFLASLVLLVSAPLAVVDAKHNLQARGSGVFVNEALSNTTQYGKAKGLQRADPANSKHFVHFDCGTNQDHASNDLLETVKVLHDDNKSGSPGAKLRARALRARQAAAGPIVIPIVFHIVSSVASANNILPTMLQAQVDALNRMYNPIGFAFTLVDTTWTTNDAWAVGAGEAMDEMKRALRRGTYSTLNIYFQSDLEGSILGKCSMPSQLGARTPAAAVDPAAYFDDGCSVNSGTMPGGPIFGYDQGMTAAHETGHWLGLFHTFEGYSCGGDGDFIADTPAQSESTDGCPAGPPPKDSCPGLPGADAVHNVMDYSTDACYTGFSPQQVERMRSMWALYRAGR
jgi:hypothetical protein